MRSEKSLDDVLTLEPESCCSLSGVRRQPAVVGHGLSSPKPDMVQPPGERGTSMPVITWSSFVVKRD